MQLGQELGWRESRDLGALKKSFDLADYAHKKFLPSDDPNGERRPASPPNS
jgi:hypothetical protein